MILQKITASTLADFTGKCNMINYRFARTAELTTVVINIADRL